MSSHSSRRMSLGAGSQRRVLGEGSSRLNSRYGSSNLLSSAEDIDLDTPQKSFGSNHGIVPAPSDYSINSAATASASDRRRSSSMPRRQSFGGGEGLLSQHRQLLNGGNSGETPLRDRRAMLQAWRQAKEGDCNSIDTSRKRTARGEPLLPPTSKHPRSTLTTTSNPSGGCLSNERHYSGVEQTENRSHHSTINYYDDDAENRTIGGSSHILLSARTPSSRRGMGSARRKSILGRNVGHSNDERSQPEPLSQLTQDIELDPSCYAEEAVDSVEGAGLFSQMERMKRRLEQLEKEKMALSMSKAPLEARFRQKEDAWVKEKNSLIDQIEVAKGSLREADEKYRDLLVQYEETSEEVTHLRHEVRKASSSTRTASVSGINSDGSSLWNRQLQNDRDLAETKEKLRAAEDEIGGIRLAKVSLEKELHATRIELTCLERNYDELKEEYDEIAAHTSENNEAEIKLQVLTEEHIATTAALNAVYADLDATKARADATMKATEVSHKKEIEQLQFDLTVMKTRASRVQVDLDTSNAMSEEEDDAVLRARIEERDKRIAELEVELLQGEQIRRQMHNTIQELRGNIRVYVRTRPFLPGDQQHDDSPVEVSPDGESLSILDRRSGSPVDFKFDKVFPPSAGQEFIFDEISDFVQSALDGYQVCLFSYGQTGSGKTHTMQGCGQGPMRGIIPRAVEKILDQARALNHQKWSFTVTASFLEIYNENLKDLLTSMHKEESKGPAKAGGDKLSIKRNREGKSYVDGLTQIPIDVRDPVSGMDQLNALMGVASRSRSVASTKMNSQSSRSHSVFVLHLNGYNEDSGAIVSGALNLCDLAGSERLDRSGADSDAQRLKETQSINKSLSCLGDVFNALATGASHVPYRNSKLTYLLQDCLSGDGKALMFVNLSPTTASCGESVCSLRFAQRVNQVELGKATKNIEYSGRGKR